MSQPLKVIDPWYREGLHFACTGCGQCCTGSPGYVWLTEDEAQTIAKYLNISTKDFTYRFLRQVDGKLSLKEHPKTFDCVFLKENKCQIYSVRPTQCRTFPWWPTLLKSKSDWEAAKKRCEGIRDEAPLVPFDQIQEQLNIQKKV
jgi:Fe-S-cluster containining protein